MEVEDIDPDVAAGLAVGFLLENPQLWMHRRVETVELLTQEETRFRVSVDFSILPGPHDDLAQDGFLRVPIAALSKRPRRHFDVRDESGTALPVLGRRENGDLAKTALASWAVDILPDDLPFEESSKILGSLIEIVDSDPAGGFAIAGDMLDAAITGSAGLENLFQHTPFLQLLELLIENYLLVVLVPREGPTRRIVKFSYGVDLGSEMELVLEEIPQSRIVRWWRSPDSQAFVLPCPMAPWGESFHLELAIPEELRVRGASFVDSIAEEFVGEPDLDVNRASLYLRGEQVPENTSAYVEIIPERAGMISQGLLLGLATTTVLVIGVLSGLDSESPDATVSVLLAGFALFSGMTALRGKHVMVVKAFSKPRRWITSIGIAALVGSISLALEFPNDHPAVVWSVSAAASAIATGRLALSTWRAAG